MRNYLVFGQRLSRSFATSSRTRIQNRVIEKQKIFQEDNNLPVHTKGGTSDVILFRITMGISIAGTCLSLFELFKAARPKHAK
ncbi:cytochrome c oxidase subunit 7A2, mitochondrial [Pelobates cultripes]|uniref:Cytochrome c oxidase subunit 7A1, mitochondrial n=1 Tax=Pelobates cultripes TaxID=61616 RepID=A0AAD1T2S0_PELCU|nr:cytochrome c oxidase subunit 7A2, mitochondrial [Pelobates cultripes]